MEGQGVTLDFKTSLYDQRQRKRDKNHYLFLLAKKKTFSFPAGPPS